MLLVLVLGIFPRATFQVTISKGATSQMFNFSSGNFPKVWLGAADCNGRGRGLVGRAPRQEEASGPSAVVRTDLGSCRLVNCTVKKLPLGKIPLGRCHLGKYLWEGAT